MDPAGRLSPEEQAGLTARLREFVRQETARGIPMESILLACQECGLLGLFEEMEDEEPEVED